MDLAEKDRLAKLEAFKIMGTDPEPQFNRLARLASHVVENPISWICFHDTERQWVKAQDGAEIPLDMPRDRTLCRRVVDTAAGYQVADLAEDPGKAAAFVMERFGLRSYVGVPILADGFAIGSVAAADFEAKRIDAERERMLTDIADLVMTELRLRRFEEAKRPLATGERRWGDSGSSGKLFRSLTREHLRVLQAINDPIIAVNRAGEIVFVNPAAERMLARPAGSLVGHSFDRIRHRPEGDAAACPIRKTMKDGTERIIRNQHFLRGDGTPFPVEIVSSPIRIGAEVMGTMVICRDASKVQDLQGVKLRQALKEIAKLKQQIARSSDGSHVPELLPFERNAANLKPRVLRDQQLVEVASHLHAAEIEQIMRAMALTGSVIEGPLGAAAVLDMPAQNLRRKLAAIEAVTKPKRISRVDRWTA
ncbi:PAS domain-containing protein [Jiella sp. M17.18]|uniref:PAS domain-containing protein n=1 Tax=Jiella sp. M17.18 TaxID=3234247 RepID=UPI0034DEFB3A